MEIEEFEKKKGTVTNIGVPTPDICVRVIEPTIRRENGKVVVELDDEEFEMDNDQWYEEQLTHARKLLNDAVCLIDIVADKNMRDAFPADLLHIMGKTGTEMRKFLKELEGMDEK